MTMNKPLSKKDAINFLLVGVGGQGTILASDIVAEIGVESGFDVKKAEVHGMSQRGGSVVSHVRWGQQVFSPTASKGEVDVILAFEKVEAARFIDFIKPGGIVLINDHSIAPITVSMGASDYPDDETIKTLLDRESANVYWIKCIEIAEALGNVKTANVVLLGALASLFDYETEIWFKVVEKRVPDKLASINFEAFKNGMASIG